MARPRKDYRIKLQGHRAGHPFFDLLVDGKKFRLTAFNQEAAATEAAARYQQIVAERKVERARQATPGPQLPALTPEKGSLREAIVAYLSSDTFRLYKPATIRQRHSMPTHIDVLCGNYRDVLVYNQKAIAVDRKYLAREGAMNVYSLYRTHNHHFAIYGAMFSRSVHAGAEGGPGADRHHARGAAAHPLAADGRLHRRLPFDEAAWLLGRMHIG